MSLCDCSLLEKLLYVPAGQELEAGEIIATQSQRTTNPSSPACQQSPWKHIFSRAFQNCFEGGKIWVVSAMKMTKAKDKK